MHHSTSFKNSTTYLKIKHCLKLIQPCLRQHVITKKNKNKNKNKNKSKKKKNNWTMLFQTLNNTTLNIFLNSKILNSVLTVIVSQNDKGYLKNHWPHAWLICTQWNMWCHLGKPVGCCELTFWKMVKNSKKTSIIVQNYSTPFNH